jgi:hypothetical protein
MRLTAQDLREMNILKYYRPTSERSIFYNNKSYTDKVYNKAIDDMIKDKNR